ncbi:hypothetical protein BWQ96_05196 [Gracilariopsis chorda]|uniref:Uncharacterized protein n=1 Tax=Gracilariopsis chorda TaxID=448386 RepID=A0A2V3ISF1_9FLOR|nr:hypothetical protein BWQ96_05196 [Gracilariopsis chorda]|eukprot:PXF45055.1 hypothetical protein BWQ96_05196 [Gracilariopsis chorda]
MAVESAQMARRLARRERKLSRREEKLRRLKREISESESNKSPSSHSPPRGDRKPSSSKQDRSRSRSPKRPSRRQSSRDSRIRRSSSNSDTVPQTVSFPSIPTTTVMQSGAHKFPRSNSAVLQPHVRHPRAHANVLQPHQVVHPSVSTAYRGYAPYRRVLPRSNMIHAGLRAPTYANVVPPYAMHNPMISSPIPRAVSVPYGISRMARRPYGPHGGSGSLFL